MFVDGSGALKKTDDLSTGQYPKSSVLCTTLLLITMCVLVLSEKGSHISDRIRRQLLMNHGNHPNFSKLLLL